MAVGGENPRDPSEVDAATPEAEVPVTPEPAEAGTPPAASPTRAPAPPSPVVFGPLDEDHADAGGAGQNLDIVLDVPLEVSVELGRRRMSIRQILDLGSGSIVELDKVAGEPVDLLVNGRLVARGEVVVIEDNFGVRITEIVGGANRASDDSKAE